MRNRLSFSTVEKRVSYAIRKFLQKDGDLLANDVAELAIAHRFATVLESEFPGRDVDANYNRHGVEVKRVPQSAKHRYIFFLDRSWQGRLRVPALPYPKKGGA